MIAVVIMYSEIIILDEISNEFLAIKFQSRFANSSGFPNSRILKVRQNFITNMRPVFEVNNA